MKTIFYFFLFSFLVFISCSSESEPQVNEPRIMEGKQVFLIDFKEIKAQSASQKGAENLEPAYALISMNNSVGTSVITRERIVLNEKGGSYITSEIDLEVGSYSLTEFIVIDENNLVISLAPKENSILSQFTNAVLPLEFEISENVTNETVAENIYGAGYSSVDFGYSGLSLTFPENTDFFSLTIDDSEQLTTKIIALKSLTGSSYVIDWGDGVIEEYVSTKTDTEEENELIHLYEQKDSYTVTISGPIEVIEYFSFNGEIPNETYKYQNNLVSVDLSKLKLLKNLTINTGKLSNLDTSANTDLEYLSVSNNNLKSLDLTNNPNLKKVIIGNNSLTNLDISQNLALEDLRVSVNQLTNLEIATNVNLKILSAWENELYSLDISKNLKLQYLDVDRNLLTDFDTTNNPDLVVLSIGQNQLTSIDVSKSTELKDFDVRENQISSLDISNNEKLETLSANDNLLTNLNITNNPLLGHLILANNNLNNLDLSNNTYLSSLQIANNQFNESSLDQIISKLYGNAISNSIMEGRLWYTDNPGTENIDTSSLSKLQELTNLYQWYIYGN